jgi:hypothetical protein
LRRGDVRRGEDQQHGEQQIKVSTETVQLVTVPAFL